MTYSVIRADLDKDAETILSIWKRNFPALNKKGLDWGYRINPYGQARCWLLHDSQSNQFVGFASLMPRMMMVDGKERLAGIAADFCVDKEHRTLAPALLLQKTMLASSADDGFDFLYGFPNKKSEKVLQRAGYKVLGNVVRLAKPLKSYRNIKEYTNPVVAKIASPLVDFWLEKTSKEYFYRPPKGLAAHDSDTFDQKFEEFWKQNKPQVRVVGVRDFQFLDWRYSQNEIAEFRSFYATDENTDAIKGYLVYRIRDSVCHLTDVVFPLGDPCADFLLSEFFRSQRKKGIDSISLLLLGSPKLRKKLDSFGFKVRESSAVLQIYETGRQKSLVLPTNPDDWCLLQGDHDV